MYLQGLAEALPIFAATGHTNYSKSVYLHLQNMRNLEQDRPDIYELFSHGRHIVRRTNRNWAGIPPDLLIEQTLMRTIKSSAGLTHGSGMSEMQRTTWLLAMPVTSEYKLAMQSLTDIKFKSSEQHKELTTTRLARDNADTSRLIERLQTISPYCDDPCLRNIVSGVTANVGTNAQDIRSVGIAIVKKMSSQDVFKYTQKRNEKVRTLGATMSVKVNNCEVSLDPALLFQRLFIVASSSQMDLDEVLKYELCSYPTSLFDNPTCLRRPDKPQLARALTLHAQSTEVENMQSSPTDTHHYVLDGGSLLHRLPWGKGITYEGIADSYATFVHSHYGTATVVFDGYQSGATIKDMTHANRRQKFFPNVSFSPSMHFNGWKEDFLSNTSNKQRIIFLIGKHLSERGCTVKHSVGDADVDIAKTAVASAVVTPTTVIAEDTDLLVLLLYWCDVKNCRLLMRSDVIRAKSIKAPTEHDIYAIRSSLQDEVVQCLLMLHAFTGCDSTSRIFSVGKQTVFKRIVTDEQFRADALLFSSAELSPSEVDAIGCRIMVQLFGGKAADTLSGCRKRQLMTKVKSSKTFVSPERLPPTASATKYHSLRSYLQVRIWQCTANDLNPADWGWSKMSGEYVPMTTDLTAAPETLLNVIRCNCHTGCSTMRCSCKSNGLKCSVACGDCQETVCQNSENVVYSEYSTTDEESDISCEDADN
jgi:hypothetical protein